MTIATAAYIVLYFAKKAVPDQAEVSFVSLPLRRTPAFDAHSVFLSERLSLHLQSES